MALAPIEPITMNPVIRELMAINGARLVYRPKILPQHLLKAPNWQYWAKIKKISQVKTPSGKSVFDGIQIIARPGDPIKKAVKYIDNYANKIGIHFIDLNFCCPGYKVLPKRRGGDLLKDPETIIQVISEVIKFTSLPISIKIRKACIPLYYVFASFNQSFCASNGLFSFSNGFDHNQFIFLNKREEVIF